MKRAFEETSSAALRRLAAAFRNGQLAAPLTPFSISKVEPVSDALVAALQQLSADGLRAAHLGLLLDLAADAAEARIGSTHIELVWTGPEASISQSRDTAVVVEELFARADRNVLVSSFAVQQGSTVFAPLARRMEEVPGLHVRLFLHVPREWKDTRDDSELLRQFAEDFRKQWPWPRRPEVYYDPRTLSTDQSTRAAWHAKCVVVDDERALVTSANFTEWAQQRNVEAGVLVHNRQFASQLLQQFEGLVHSKQVRRLPGY